MPEEPDQVSRKALRRDAQRLHTELVKLRRKVEAASKHAGVERPEELPDVPDDGSATATDLERALNPAKQALVDLALAINSLSRRGAAPAAKKRHRRRVSSSPETYRIRMKESVRNRTVTLTNRGRELVVNPRIVVNGRRDWFSTATILAEILRPGMSDREKAIAIWEFLRDNRCHDEPAHDGIELHDPVRFLNAYGYGYCNDAAVNLAVLAEQVGIPSRVWGLSGHVVPEVHFDGAWHMLDPDGEIYYLDDDGETISSVSTLEQRPDIIRKYRGTFGCSIDRVVEIYTTTEDNRVMPWYKEISEARHTMAYVLRPGESLLRSWDNWGLYFSSLYLDEPERYGNGRFTFEPIFEGDLFRKGAESVGGLRSKHAGGRWMLAPSGARGKGSLIYRFASPYPILDGAVSVNARISGTGSLEVRLSETGDNWQAVWSADSAGPVKRNVPIGGYFRNGYGRPVYSYLLDVRLSGGAQVSRLRITSDVQVAPASLPALESGQNEVRYVDDTRGDRDVGITFGYD